MEIIRRLGTMAESAPVTVVISLLSGTKAGELPRCFSGLDLRAEEFQDIRVEGELCRVQLLVYTAIEVTFVRVLIVSWGKPRNPH